MEIKHGGYLRYIMPTEWCIQEDNGVTCIYDNDGDGAMTMSYYDILDLNVVLDEYIGIMAKKFIAQNKIILNKAPIIDKVHKDKTILYATGNTSDNWFVKLWIIAKVPKVVVATYQSQHRTAELEIYDGIIDSMVFDFDNL